MSAAHHTPGPWLQYADTNIVICKWRGPGAESLRVCEVSTNTRDDEGRHNLNLITAAPDLLDALQVIVQDDAIEYAVGGMYTIAVNGRDLIQARAAIAKATGSAA